MAIDIEKLKYSVRSSEIMGVEQVETAVIVAIY